jgi:hypothetical protein
MTPDQTRRKVVTRREHQRTCPPRRKTNVYSWALRFHPLCLAAPERGCRAWQPASLLVPPQKQVPIARIKAMKYVLSGTAIAAALVIAAPVWAQTAAPRTPPASAPSATSAPMGSMGSHTRSHRVKARRHHATRRGGAGASDNIANQLNAQEAARNAGGGMGGAPGGMGAPAPGGMGGAPAPAYGGPRTAPYGQPNQIYGIPGAGQPSPSPPPQ